MQVQNSQPRIEKELQGKVDELRVRKQQTLATRKALLDKMPDPGISAEQHPKIVAKFNGYMTLLQKKMEKEGVTSMQDYYSSSYFTDLKEKRNISFSQDILEKMYKQYCIEEYSSNMSRGIFDPTAPILEDEYYEALDRRAGDKLRK